MRSLLAPPFTRRRVSVVASISAALALTVTLSPFVSGSLATAAAEPAETGQASSTEPELVPSLSTSTSNTYAQPDGSLTAELFTAPVNYQDDSGSWQPIDNTLVDAAGSTFDVTNSANEYTALIPANPAVTPVRFSVGSHWVSMRMHGLREAAQVSQDTAAFAQVRGADLVEYVATNTGLKENIVLDSAPTSTSQLEYTYTIDTSHGLSPVMTDEGGVDFRDGAGATVIAVPPGFMFDSSAEGATSEAVPFRLASEGDSWTLTVTPDLGWLLDPARVYPVTIDPTLDNVTPIRDCWITQTDINAHYCGDGLASSYLRVGKSSDGDKRRTLLDFDVSSIPASAQVTSAQVSLFLDQEKTTGTDDSANYALFAPGKRWENSATWKTTGTGADWAVGGGDPTGPAYGSQSLTGKTIGRKDFTGLEPMVQQWINANSNHYGMVLKQVEEQKNHVLWFYSSSAAATNDNKRPRLTVNYNDAYPTNPGGGGVYWSLPATKVYTARVPANTTTVITPPTIANPTNTLGALTDWNKVASVTGELRVSGWASRTGSVSIDDADDAPEPSPDLSWGYSDSSATGRTAKFISFPSGDNQFAVVNTSAGAVDVTWTVVGWNSLMDSSAIEDATETDPEETFDATAEDAEVALAPVTETTTETAFREGDSMSASTSACSEAVSSTNDPILSCAEKLIPTADTVAVDADAVANQFAVPSGVAIRCWQSSMKLDRWYWSRKQACRVGYTLLRTFVDNTCSPAEGCRFESRILESVGIAMHYEQVNTAHNNTAISHKVQFRYIPCGGPDDPRAEDKQECGTSTQAGYDYGMFLKASLKCPDCVSGGGSGPEFTEKTYIDKDSQYSQVFFSRDDQRNSGAIAAGTSFRLLATSFVFQGSPSGNDSYGSTRAPGASHQIRCDNLAYVNSRSSGCVFSGKEPVFKLSAAQGSAVKETATHIRERQGSLATGYKFGLDMPLQRVTDPADRKRNQRKACRNHPTGPGQECDEFPFASTQQGCATWARDHKNDSLRRLWGCHPKAIPAADNQESGKRLNRFYRQNRILRAQDNFWVTIYG